MASSFVIIVFVAVFNFFVLHVESQQSPPPLLSPPPPPPSPSPPPPPPPASPSPPPPPSKRPGSPRFGPPQKDPSRGYDSHHRHHGNWRSPSKDKPNLGKKIGLLFLGIVVILQLCVAALLMIKRRQLLKTLERD